MSAMLEDKFAGDEDMCADMRMIGGRALREMTRLGAMPLLNVARRRPHQH